MNKCFEVKNLTFYYPEQEKAALNDISFDIEAGSFVTLMGPSGSGKSTLLRMLKIVLAPHGFKSGEVFFENRLLDEIEQREQAGKIGFVLQSPENQIVTDRVWHELAFGLESLSIDTPTIRARVAEMASFFGIQNWFYKNVEELSGGQKQMLNLASVMVMQPSILILDEPTAQLDPIAAGEFLSALAKINHELATTILISEHRLKEVFPLSDRVIVIDDGRIISLGTPQEISKELTEKKHSMFLGLPTAVKIWAAVEKENECPITVKEGRTWLDNFVLKKPLRPILLRESKTIDGKIVLNLEDLWFKYEKNSPHVIRGLSLALKAGDFLALLGGNGTGKTTALSLIAGLRVPERGLIEFKGTIGLLPQNPQTIFVKKTVREDLFDIFSASQLPKQTSETKIAQVVKLCRLETLLERHPYDLSGGERQRAALAKVLLTEPEILLLDEPTKGLDAEYKEVFAGILKDLLSQGVAILMVSHDVEFCALYAHRCALFFDGNIVAQGSPQSFFGGNSFYTTAANRIARHLLPMAITTEDVVEACGIEKPYIKQPLETSPIIPQARIAKPESNDVKLPLWRKGIAAISALIVLIAFIKAVGITDLSAIFSATGFSSLATDYVIIYILLIGSLFVFSLSVNSKAPAPKYPIQIPKEKRKLGKRTLLAALIILLLIPLTIFIGVYYLGSRKYYFIAMLILLQTMLPFALVFEDRKPKARELAIIAALCAMAVAGRAAFFMLPEFKPVVALVIVSGVAFGGETGFLVGAMTMLVSNIMFSQGPWTPWQMFAMGIIGFLAGVLYRKGLLRRSRVSLCIFGAIAAVVIYGGIMNPAAALMWSHTLDLKILLTYYLTGLPIDLVRAAATVFFLWFGAEPLLEKLDRIKVKYGLVE